jgi:hypothetical protein
VIVWQDDVAGRAVGGERWQAAHRLPETRVGHDARLDG